MTLCKSNQFFVADFRCRTISACCHEKLLFCFCLLLLFFCNITKQWLCLFKSKQSSVIDNCKFVPGKSGLKREKGEKGKPCEILQNI